ncbi:hypothetical protein [Psychrobacter urativorans]|uniref:Uncharacterized protein n=1 Tax=Psychrobacter urativorans TaxID=45610 RepID=A0A0M5MNQ1_9GAMM|nr:hypothetical protein [Psychrobacter urativorans]ALF60305.1 hypothetical protein AOC03_09870 [Psychrobacter urativorans]
MEKRYKYISKRHRIEETLNMRDLGHGIYLGVNMQRQIRWDETMEQTTSIVIPSDEIPNLIEYLQGILKDEK